MPSLEKIGLGLLLLIETFGSIVLMLGIWINIKKFSTKYLKRFSILALVVQFLVVALYIYLVKTQQDNLDYSPTVVLFLAYYFHMIPYIVINYIFLIRLLAVSGKKIKAAIAMLFVTIAPLYLLVTFTGTYLIEVSGIKMNSLIAFMIAILYSSILAIYPALKRFQIWKESKTLIE